MADDASTRFPFISLDKALVRAKQLFDADPQGRSMPVVTAFQLWGYSTKSSGGFQTTGALKYYGLLEDEGSKNDRKVKLSQAGRRYFLDERDEIRAAMIAEFALTPPLFRALWENDGWKHGLPADTVARSHLKVERRLNDQSARALLTVFKETIQFAGLKPSAVPPDPLESPFDEEPESKAPQEIGQKPMQPIQSTPAASPPPPAPESPVDARIVGDRVIISANVDLKGLRRLKKQIALLEQMLTLQDDEDDEAITH